jgi:hypothetical protein
MKEAAGELLSSAAPSVKAYLKLRSIWNEVMRIQKGRKVLDLSSITEPLGIYSDELRVGVYSPAVASAIKKYEREFVKALRDRGFHVSRLVIKIVRPGVDDDTAEDSEVESKKWQFSEEDIRKACQMFSMVTDEGIRRKLAITWLKSQMLERR